MYSQQTARKQKLDFNTVKEHLGFEVASEFQAIKSISENYINS
jgi:hypothetical protein